MITSLDSPWSVSDQMLAGQRLMTGFNGHEFNHELEFLIGKLNVGGIILFARNIGSPAQVRKLCRDAQDYAQSCRLPPLFIAVDQEGGVVARLKEGFTLFPKGNPGMTTPEDAVRFARTTAREMKDVGLNMDMAPVLDVEPYGFEGIMHERVFHGDINDVADMGCAIVDTLQENNIMAVGKHFPGIGRTTLDSHLDLPYLDTPLDELHVTDLVPFRRAIDRNVSGIMLSHILYQALDDEWPASLSEKIAKDLLRHQLGYDKLVLTDDLDMKAIRHDMPVLIQRIIAAEIDVVLICHQGPKIEQAFVELRKFISATSADQDKGISSLERIVAAKHRFLSP